MDTDILESAPKPAEVQSLFHSLKKNVIGVSVQQFQLNRNIYYVPGCY